MNACITRETFVFRVFQRVFHSTLKLELCRHRNPIILTCRYGKNMLTTALVIIHSVDLTQNYIPWPDLTQPKPKFLKIFPPPQLGSRPVRSGGLWGFGSLCWSFVWYRWWGGLEHCATDHKVVISNHSSPPSCFVQPEKVPYQKCHNYNIIMAMVTVKWVFWFHFCQEGQLMWLWLGLSVYGNLCTQVGFVIHRLVPGYCNHRYHQNSAQTWNFYFGMRVVFWIF